MAKEEPIKKETAGNPKKPNPVEVKPAATEVKVETLDNIKNDTVVKVRNLGSYNLSDSGSRITYRAKSVAEKGVMTPWLRAQITAGLMKLV